VQFQTQVTSTILKHSAPLQENFPSARLMQKRDWRELKKELELAEQGNEEIGKYKSIGIRVDV
jgi:hypothetical protein